MSEPDSYTSHNFDAVNEQIKEIAARERARTKALRLESYRTGFIYAGAAALIIGLLALLLSWSYRIINAPYAEEITKVVKPEIIEKEVIKVVQVPVEKSIYDSTSTSYKGPINSTTETSSFTSSGNQSAVVTNYNTFKRVDASELGNYGISDVVTGWRYKDSNSDYPESQYCYFHKSTPGKETTLRVDLAELEDGEYVSFVNSNLAREISMTRRNLKIAEEKCQWAGT